MRPIKLMCKNNVFLLLIIYILIIILMTGYCRRVAANVSAYPVPEIYGSNPE